MGIHSEHLLLVHGSIILLLGLLSGFPFWLAIIRGRELQIVRAWRVAHATLISCGLALLVVGLAGPHLALSTALHTFLNWAFVISGYSFVFALVAGAALGRRGLTPTPFGINTLLFLGHMVGAAGSILGTCVLFFGLL